MPGSASVECDKKSEKQGLNHILERVAKALACGSGQVGESRAKAILAKIVR
jgi:hypothetical protein